MSGVLRALAILRDQHPTARLSIIGDGPDRALLEQLCSGLDLTARVEFLGRLANSKVLDHMARAGAVIINSNVETFSVVTGEALAQGKPVIATRCGGPAAFVNAHNGLLIPVGDDQALANAMDQLIRSWADVEPVTIRASVHDRFSPQAVGSAFLKIYTRVIHDHR